MAAPSASPHSLQLGLLLQSTSGGAHELAAAAAAADGCPSAATAVALQSGSFASVLYSPAVSQLLLSAGEGLQGSEAAVAAAPATAEAFYAGVRARVRALVHAALHQDGQKLAGGGCAEGGSSSSSVLGELLAAGSSCLNAFVQHNLTGCVRGCA